MRKVSPAVALVVSISCSPAPLPPTAPTPSTAGVPARIELDAAPGVGVAGGTATITARILDAHSTPLAAVPIVFSADIGTLTSADLETDATGIAHARLTAPPGAVQITATAGTVHASAAAVVQPPVVVTPPPPNLPPPPDNLEPLTVSVHATPVGATTASTVTLTASTSSLVSPARFIWAYGDGRGLDGFSPATQHQYAAVGVYSVSVRVEDGAGRSASARLDVSIAAAPPVPPPQPAYSVTLKATPATVAPGGAVLLTATVIPLLGAQPPTSFAWDCNGDGILEVTTGGNTMACNGNDYYPKPGSVTAYVYVGGDNDARGQAAFTITIAVPR